MFITGVNDTGDKLFNGVNDTGDKLIAGMKYSLTNLREFSKNSKQFLWDTQGPGDTDS
jgi:hypothetical protein